MVVGGGIGGMQAALDLADAGIKVYLVETKSAIGGVMAQLDKTFPTNDCAMCTMAPRLVEIGRHRDIEILTLSDVERVEGQAGNFAITVKRRPRFVDETRCTGCGILAWASVRPFTAPSRKRFPMSLRFPGAAPHPARQGAPSTRVHRDTSRWLRKGVSMKRSMSSSGTIPSRPSAAGSVRIPAAPPAPAGWWTTGSTCRR